MENVAPGPVIAFNGIAQKHNIENSLNQCKDFELIDWMNQIVVFEFCIALEELFKKSKEIFLNALLF